MSGDNVELENLRRRVDAHDSAMERLADSIGSIDESLKTLTRLEVRHEETRESLIAAKKDIVKLDDRIRAIEVDAPVTLLVRRWVIALVIGIATLGAMSVWYAAHPPYQAPAYERAAK